MNVAGRAILAVFAHPDDESLACGGTLARLAARGADVWLLCASTGERGGPSRAAELRHAAITLGVRGVMQFDFPDGTLRWANVSELQAAIVMALHRLQPLAVITFDEDGLYWHPDHIGVHERTTTAVRLLGDSAPPLYYVSLEAGAMRRAAGLAGARGWRPPDTGPWSVNPDAFGLHAPAPTHLVDVRGELGRKLQALRDHATQHAAGPFALLAPADAAALLGSERLRCAPGPTDPLRDIT